MPAILQESAAVVNKYKCGYEPLTRSYLEARRNRAR